MFAAAQTHDAPLIPKSLFYKGIKTAKWSYEWIMKKKKIHLQFSANGITWLTVPQNISLFFWNRLWWEPLTPLYQVPYSTKTYSACPLKSSLLGWITGAGDIIAILVLSQREDLKRRNWTYTFFHITKLSVWHHCLSNTGSWGLPLPHAIYAWAFRN